MNYILYKQSDNSIFGIRAHQNSLDNDLIASILLFSSNQAGETILCSSVEGEVAFDDYKNRYLGFDPDSNSLIINENYTPPEPEPEPESEPV